MRNVIFAINITVDGCCDHTKVVPDEEVLEYFTGLTREAGLQVFGRKTYELMVPYWPDVLKAQSATKADKDFAQAFVSLKKVVFSRSLDSVEDKNTRSASTNLRGGMFGLRQQLARDILVGAVESPSRLRRL